MLRGVIYVWLLSSLAAALLAVSSTRRDLQQGVDDNDKKVLTKGDDGNDHKVLIKGADNNDNETKLVTKGVDSQESKAKAKLVTKGVNSKVDETAKILPINDGGNLSCLANTGGTCLVQDCDAKRGATSCEHSQCICKPGFCADGLGHCSASKNEAVVVGDTLRFRNARYPRLYLSLQPHGFFLVHGSHHAGTDFRIYALPAEPRTERLSYMLVSADGTHAAGVHLDIETGLILQAMPVKRAAAEDVALHIYTAPGYEGADTRQPAVSINVVNSGNDYELFADGSTQHVRVHDSMSQKIGISTGSVGVGALWVPEPPLPASVKLHPYRGPHCDYDCGAHGSGADLESHFMGKVLWWLFWGTFIVLAIVFAWHMNRKSRNSRASQLRSGMTRSSDSL